MNNITKKPVSDLGYNFIPEQYLPKGKDEYYLREKQNPGNGRYRNLTAHEIEVLVLNRNSSDNWNQVLVSDAFNPSLVKNCKFFGLVRIGKLEPYFLEFHDLRMPVGLYGSTIINCDFGDNVVVDNVNYFSHYITGDEVIISNVHEISVSDHAKFGNGILKEGEEEDIRIWMEICNENGGRSVLPFDGMLAGDAWLWSRNRADKELQRRFREMTEKKFDNLRGYYGFIGSRTVIKNCSIVKDCKIGTDAYLKGANKLKNLTINSSEDAPTQVGEGCELVNGIIGLGCRVFYGVKAVRFITASNSQLKYGARLINSFLGDNSTISCCEVLNSLIFPAHEQHHNNSFLIAASVGGQSNMAAGATIGSNHNSRAADGELEAGRGFWPALCTSIKHSSRFAPFTLLAKADFPAELDIPFPFSLVSNDTGNDCLAIMPAYWLIYNLYALERNAWKYEARDSRPEKIQFLETHYLAPDTANAMLKAVAILEKLVGKEIASQKGLNDLSESEWLEIGKQALSDSASPIDALEVAGTEFEHNHRKTVISKVTASYRTYRVFIFHYAMEAILKYLQSGPPAGLDKLGEITSRQTDRKEFINVGGQLIPAGEVERLKQSILDYEIISWEQVHQFYTEQAMQYPVQKLEHAVATLQELEGKTYYDRKELIGMLGRYRAQAEKIISGTRESRVKDYENPFRKMVYDSEEEMKAVLGDPGHIPFLEKQKEHHKAFSAFIGQLEKS